MKLGLIVTQYNEITYIKDCLESWITYKEKNTSISLKIACVDGCFVSNLPENNSITSKDGSLEYLEELLKEGKIDSLTKLDKQETEHSARNYALNYLLSQNCSYIGSIGIDEKFHVEQIDSIVSFIKRNEFICWFSIYYKNYTFLPTTYTLGFCPPRIFKINYQGWQLKEWYFDDDPLYEKDGQKKSYKEFPSLKIPENRVLVRHDSWLNEPRSKRKVLYQENHFSPKLNRGFGCSFKWDDKEDKLVFNDEYFRLTNTQKPEIFHD